MPGSLHAQGVSELNFEKLRIRSDEEKSGVEEQCWAGMRQILIDESIKKKKKILCSESRVDVGSRPWSSAFFSLHDKWVSFS